MYLLDTNILSELMKPEPEATVLRWTDQQDEQSLFYSAITRAEILWGIEQLPVGKRKNNLLLAAQDILGFFEGRCINYSCAAADTYVDIAMCSKQAGRPMSREDMMIAAITLEQQMTLSTRNVKDFDFLPKLKLYNPWQDHA